MRKAFILVIIIVSQMACAAELPITEDWNHYLNGGIQRIDLLDLDNDGVLEAYALNFDPSKTTLFVYDLEGNQGLQSTASREQGQESGSEEAEMAAVRDLDGNGFLDILSATVIKASAVTNHRLYRLQRVPEEGLGRMYSRYVWMVKDTGMVTSISFADVNHDGTEEIITSSVDDRIRAYDPNGADTINITLDSSIWHVTAIPPKAKPQPNATEASKPDSADDSTTSGGTTGGGWKQMPMPATGFAVGGSLLGGGGIGGATPRLSGDNDTSAAGTQPQTASSSPHPVLTDYTFLAGCFNGLFLVDGGGNIIWSSPSDAKYELTAASDLSGDGTMQYIGYSGAAIRSFDRKGKMLWEYHADKVSGLEAIEVYGRKGDYLMASADDRLLFFDGFGTLMWTYQLKGSSQSLKAVKDPDKLRIFVGLKDGIEALSIDEGYFKGAEADANFAKASEAYRNDDFNLTATLAHSAYLVYVQIGRAYNASEASSLETDVNDLLRAEDAYQKAQGYYKDGDFDKSAKSVQEAIDVYTRLNYAKGLNKTAQLGSDSGAKATEMAKVAEAKRKADADYAIAEGYFVNGSAAMCRRYAQMALEGYHQIGYEQGIRLSEHLMELNDGGYPTTTTTTATLKEPVSSTTTTQPAKKAKDDGSTYAVLLVGAIIFAAVVYLAYQLRRG